MAEHERPVRSDQEESESKRRGRKQASSATPSFEMPRARDQRSFPTGAAFGASMDEHAAALSGITTSVQRGQFIMRLQQTYGNRYVQRLLASAGVQAQLNVSNPGDQYELEAEQVAERVMGALAAAQQAGTPAKADTAASDAGSHTDGGLAEGASGPSPESTLEKTETRIHAARGSGHRLPDEVERPMARTFGTDLGEVRVHNDAEADALNRDLDAKAFTSGRDIFFRAGEYGPGSDSGRRLIAHELAHVVQQQADQPQRDARQGPVAAGDADANAPARSIRTIGADRTFESTETYRLRVKIKRTEPSAERRAPTNHRSPQVAGADSVPGGVEEEIEEEPGESVQVTITDDPVRPTLNYGATVAQGGITVGTNEFGKTGWTAAISNVNVKQAEGAFEVGADIDCPIHWDVHSLGKTNISSETDAAITKANYATVASDLTPDLSSDGGRPPRTKFWASGLTERHESFHADEFKTYGKAGFDLANTWLGGQTAVDAAKAEELTRKVPFRMRDYVVANYLPGAETRAYGDGAPSYQSRADAVNTRGAAGEYK